ncbi:hypothetical protein GCM10010376_77640 [Streptomyces violaceusniger]
MHGQTCDPVTDAVAACWVTPIRVVARRADHPAGDVPVSGGRFERHMVHRARGPDINPKDLSCPRVGNQRCHENRRVACPE